MVLHKAISHEIRMGLNTVPGCDSPHTYNDGWTVNHTEPRNVQFNDILMVS